MSKTARQAATSHRPSGRQCAECQRAAEDCSRLDFSAMPPAGKRDADGVQRVACRCYVRADEHPCCGALASGPHKMGCILQAHERVALPATRDAGGVVTVCQRPCRCGPDGCADSVACPRHNRNDG